MAAPGDNMSMEDRTESTEGEGHTAAAEQTTIDANLSNTSQHAEDNPQNSNASDSDNQENVAEAKESKTGQSREVSPAISEGSIEGDLVQAQGEGTERNSSNAQAVGTKSKKKEDKSIEHILKALNSLETPEEKLAALCKKYADLHEEHRQMKMKYKQTQHKLTAVLREKDQLQGEHSKAILGKSKLESLCRELQRHNKLIKDESYARAREEEEKRKEVTNKFQQTINDIQQQMNDHYAKNAKLREENVDLANKLKTLIEQYEQREQHVEKMMKHKELEQQLVDARLQQATVKMSEEKERSQQEKQILLTEAAEANKKVQLLEEQEKALRAQVGLYTEKYEEFQATLSKSNEVFTSFKVEMDKMTKKIKKLEKETNMWKARWENSNRALAQMADEKTMNDKENTLLMTKVKKLESLCRALQQERNSSSPSTQATPAAADGDSTRTSEEQPSSKDQLEETKASSGGVISDDVVVASEEEVCQPSVSADIEDLPTQHPQHEVAPSVDLKPPQTEEPSNGESPLEGKDGLSEPVSPK